MPIPPVPLPVSSPIVVPVEVQQSVQQLLTLVSSIFSSIAILAASVIGIINLIKAERIHVSVNSQNDKLLSLVEREAYARGAKESTPPLQPTEQQKL